ncbi:MAG TPA: AI-2E family transporter [Bacteroidales bacterium]|nr:AI-2E family transporter [Bacteroidales bacterium]
MARKLSIGLKFALFILASYFFIAGIIQARNFLYPLTFAIMFSYLLYPLANFLEKRSFPRILAILISILSAIIILGSIFYVFYTQMTSLLEGFSSLKEQAITNIELLQKNLQNWLGLKDNKIADFLKMQVDQFFSGQGNGLRKIFTTTTSTILNTVVLPVYTFLFMYYRTKFAYFILKLVPKGKEFLAIKILRDISTIAASYMGGVTIVVIILIVLNSTGLLIIGVKYAIFFGMISAFFNFIPYFGTLMGGSIPFLFVLLTTSDPLHFGLRVALLFVIIQFIENNILTPNIVGGHVKLNPFIIIVGLVLGGTVWGIPGLLVTVPFLAILRVIFANLQPLAPLSYLMGPRGTRKHAITLPKIKHFLQSKFHKKN